MELISYHGGDGETAEQPIANVSNIGWHNDGATLVTVAVAFSSAGRDFGGGELQARSGYSETARYHNITDIQRGDVIAWRGWDKHRVLPLLWGQRQVVVAEWWAGEPCSDTDARKKDTLVAVRSALDFDPFSSILNTLMAEYQLEDGNDADAEGYLQRALASDAMYPRALSHMARLHIRKGNHSGAEHLMRLAIQQGDQALHLDLASRFMRQGKYLEAAMSYKEACRLNPKDFLAHTSFAEALSKLGKYENAASISRWAIKIAPEHIPAHNQLIFALTELGDVEGAREASVSLEALSGGVPADSPVGGMEGLLNDPVLMAAMRKPKVKEALASAMSNPASLTKHMTDPEVGPVIERFMKAVGVK